ncbi:MAG TPA: GNAT family N-acetyltransferase [Acidimicrobiales bacterium]|nr:GNAT family N-acetyltransferase [Acidimicrobiales bacterium]
MGWTIRVATEADVPALLRADWAAFGGRPTDAQIDTYRAFLEAERCFLAEDGDRVVGSAGNLSLELTVPGPVTVPTAGVTVVGVMPTHRRQGILTALMARIADDARRRGEPVAALLASESTIYRRFGYGPAVMSSAVELERTHARLRRPPEVAGRVRILDEDEMKTVLPAIHDRYRRQQPGEVSRKPGWWARYLEDPPERRGGAGARFAAVWEDDQGYVTYRVTQNWETGFPSGTLSIEHLLAVDPAVRAGLWQFCFGIDLIAPIKAYLAVDDPLRWMLVDPRRLRTTSVTDFLWVNLIDVEAALSARSYATDAGLVIEVAGDGRYRLAGGACRRTDDLADLALEAPDLGAAYLGGVRFATLARAGLVTELSAGALARADAAFATVPGPISTTGF